MVLGCCIFVACHDTPNNTPQNPIEPLPDPPPHEHNFAMDWTSDDTHHWHEATCEHNELVSDKDTHSLDGDGKCSVCGYRKKQDIGPQPNPHEHEFVVYEIRSYCHLMQCDCGEGDEGAHVYDDDGICTVCGAKEHAHFYDRYLPCPYDVDSHWIICECGVVQKYEKHVFVGEATCILCNATKHEHRWQYIGERDETHHYMACVDCGKWISREHDCTDEDACSVCGYVTHEHDWQVVETANRDEHVLKCVICGLTSAAAHDFDDGDVCSQCGAVKHNHNWVYNGETLVSIHGLYCDDCGGVAFEKHVFKDGSGACSVCGAPPHTHKYEFVEGCDIIDDYHQVYCEECGDTGWQQHTYGANEVCTKCGQPRSVTASQTGEVYMLPAKRFRSAKR